MPKIYFVVFCTNGQVENILKMTKSQNLAQYAALDAATKCLGRDHEDVRGLLEDFSDRTITDNFTLTIERDKESGPLILQMLAEELEG